MTAKKPQNLWLSRTPEYRCLLFERRPSAQQGGCSWHTQSWGVNAAPTTGGGTLCPERRCHGLIHILLEAAQTAAAQQQQQQQRRSRTAAFKNTADLNTAAPKPHMGRL